MPSPERCWGVLPAAGVGSRMGADLPKQYLQLAGATVVEHSLNALLASPRLAGVVVALHPDDRRAARLPVFGDERVQRVAGGAQRSDSVQAALAALLAQGEPGDWVLVHDAARPCLPADDLERLIDRVTTSGVGGLLATAIVDTVKQATEAGLVARTLDRTLLWRAQTPQMFRLGELHAALDSARGQGLVITDEASAMELAGHPVQLVPGSARNLKVTLPEDLQLAAWYLGEGFNR
ncbi:MAG: 2-C-methyl-D-erythritol 4-phosphate cytidylyltransferase [Halieaceae bacterium]|nr:2-C-methyl-D-erythritol 4-phosphate cytidylyltransferase [Halieaceae bacterium]